MADLTEARVQSLLDAYVKAHCDWFVTGHESAKAYAALARSDLLDAINAQPAAPSQRVEARTRDAGWFALVMGAAASLEDAENCLRDPDARRAAKGAAKHYRKAANAMWSQPVEAPAESWCTPGAVPVEAREPITAAWVTRMAEAERAAGDMDQTILAPVDTVPVPRIVAWSGGPAPYKLLRVILDDSPQEHEYVPASQPVEAREPVVSAEEWRGIAEISVECLGSAERLMARRLEAAEGMAKALRLNQWGFNHRRCSVCSGWGMGPDGADGGESDHTHTADCPVGTALAAWEGAR